MPFVSGGAGAASSGAAPRAINVKNYGALGDGSTDDGAAIALALAALDDANGWTLYFPAGTYLTSQRITETRDCVRFLGDNGSTLDDTGTTFQSEIRFSGTGATAFITATAVEGFRLEGLTISYSSSSFTGHLIDASSSFKVKIVDCLFRSTDAGTKTAASCLRLDSTVEALIDTCTFSRAADLVSLYQANAISFRSTRFVNGGTNVCQYWGAQNLFEGCIFEYPVPINLSAGSGLSFINCGFWDASFGPGPTNWVTGGSANGLAFVGCYFEIMNGGTAFSISAADGMVVEGCRFIMSGAGSANVWGTPSGAGISNLQWGGNTLGSGITDNKDAIDKITPTSGVIYDSTLSGAAASFDVQNIPATYRYLEVIFSGRGTAAADQTSAFMRFNNDSTAGNYMLEQMVGEASSASASASASIDTIYLALIAAGNAPAGRAGAARAIIPNYAGTTFNKVVEILAGTHRAAGDTMRTVTTHALWKSTSAINRVTVYAEAGNFAAGSRLTIVGHA